MTEQSSDGIDRSGYGGGVDSDVSYFRGSGTVVRFGVMPGVTCHQCGSGEIWQPMQAMDMPIVLSCLMCGATAPSERYNRTGTNRGENDD